MLDAVLLLALLPVLILMGALYIRERRCEGGAADQPQASRSRERVDGIGQADGRIALGKR